VHKKETQQKKKWVKTFLKTMYYMLLQLYAS